MDADQHEVASWPNLAAMPSNFFSQMAQTIKCEEMGNHSAVVAENSDDALPQNMRASLTRAVVVDCSSCAANEGE